MKKILLNTNTSSYQMRFDFDTITKHELEPRNSYDINLEPLDATFRDNNQAPLHSWFPYLEGYSPKFVERARQEFLPNAKRIIEPFAGSGTTPIVLGQTGIDCAYSEANPAMVFVTQTKLGVLKLNFVEKNLLRQKMNLLAYQLAERLYLVKPNIILRNSYLNTFNDSEFFDNETLEIILRLRTINDEVYEEDKLLGDCFALAILASLIPVSRLKRAGDLRYKTKKELLSGTPNVVQAVRDRLLAQANDLAYTTEIKTKPRFACDSAKSLKDFLDHEWDGVITSPPYLNGTNYIRNARLELWYLQYLKTKNDLRNLRDLMITSGINDVAARTKWEPVTDGVRRVIENIEAKAYDVRIAKMVGGYFQDMASVLLSLSACVRNGGKLCIDIGDSIYAGVHVPTDDLLVEVAESIGFSTLERINLRKRISKNGQIVRQQLLVFEKNTESSKNLYDHERVTIRQTSANSEMNWNSKWESFKKELPHQKLPYSKREWGGAGHSMCSYQGKMKPALAHHLIDCFSQENDIVVDPFSGSGTIPYEACRMGRFGYGMDISSLGYALTLAKVAEPTTKKIKNLLDELEVYIQNYELTKEDRDKAAEIQFNSSIPDYFHPDTLREIIAARKFYLERWDSGAEWALLLACTLHILHGNRPYALSRKSHPITPYKPTGPFEYRALMPRLKEKLGRIKDEFENTQRAFGAAFQIDCTTPWTSAIPQADVIITSPPFFDSTRFYMTNWMRFWFAGWERADFDIQPANFVEIRQKKNLDVYQKFFVSCNERLKKDGLLILHLGQSPKCDMATELANRVGSWFSVLDTFTEDVEHCESHGIRDKGSVSGHSYLILKNNK